MEKIEFLKISKRLQERFEKTKEPWWCTTTWQASKGHKGTLYSKWVDQCIRENRQYPLPMDFTRFAIAHRKVDKRQDLPMGCGYCAMTGFVWAMRGSSVYTFLCDCNERYMKGLSRLLWSERDWELLGFSKMPYCNLDADDPTEPVKEEIPAPFDD